jgi:hypothetical protein
MPMSLNADDDPQQFLYENFCLEIGKTAEIRH